MDDSQVKLTPRPPFWMRLSIASGNLLQMAGVVSGCAILYAGAHLVAIAILRVLLFMFGWLIVYICSHSLGHWLVGWLVGIRFREYGIRGTDHPNDLNPFMRAVLTRLPMFTAITDKASMEKASPLAKALMFGAGETSTILCTVLAGLSAWLNHVPGGVIFLILAILMSVTGVISTSRMTRGDYAKARQALRER